MNYNFLDDLLLRNPFFSYTDYSILKISNIAHNSHFQTALYLASPSFYATLKAKGFENDALTPKEKASILRYYNRMCFRPTPFGSFSSFTLTNWGPDKSLRLDAEQAAKLHVNIDQEIVLYLAEELAGGELDKYIFVCNPALYKAGREFRFIKTNYGEGKRNILFDLESYEYNSSTVALISFCADNFRYGNEIMAFMIQISGCDQKTAMEYLNFLVSAQILIPRTSPNIIGEDYLRRLLDCGEIPITPFRQELVTIYDDLQKIAFPGIADLIKISARLKKLYVYLKEKPNQLFYTGLERTTAEGSLLTTYQQHIRDGLTALEVLSIPVQPPALQKFIFDFKNRYDRKKIPLPQAIDPEAGIGYGQTVINPMETELLREVNFRQPKNNNIQLEWSPVHRLLLKRWIDNLKNTDPILLNETDLLSVQSDSTLSLPPTLSALFRALDDGIYLETVGGVSATALIGRFTAWNDGIHNLSERLASQEQAANPGVIFADIGQLSDAHADNINRRKHSYKYEITVNAISTLPKEYQINLSDLWISVAGDKLILESESLQKIVIPRLSSAYNYNRNQLAVFRLLCDLQYQGLQGNLSFDLERYFPGLDYYPRVAYKKTILCPAKWHLFDKQLKDIFSSAKSEYLGKFKSIRDQLNLPAIIALSRFDQQLVFNIDNEDEVFFLLDCLKGLEAAVIQEYFLPVQPIVTNHEGMGLVNQFIAFLYQNEMVYHDQQISDAVPIKKIEREYILGSRWLYLKLYCNPSAANDLLVKKIHPILKYFQKQELISWFYIRYSDSGHHIRLRLKVADSFLDVVLLRLKKSLSGVVHFHIVREYQADTYRREIERYGSDIISLVEGFFYGSSELVLNYIRISRFKSFRYSYHSLAIVSVAHLLNRFLPKIDDQLLFLGQMVQTFYKEFSSDKSLKIDLDQKYREIKKEVVSLLASQDYYKKLKLTKWADLFMLKTSLVLKSASGFSTKRRSQLLADLIHMHLNRIFIDRPRNQELIIYYCLYKYQLSVKAMNKKAG